MELSSSRPIENRTIAEGVPIRPETPIQRDNWPKWERDVGLFAHNQTDTRLSATKNATSQNESGILELENAPGKDKPIKVQSYRGSALGCVTSVDGVEPKAVQFASAPLVASM